MNKENQFKVLSIAQYLILIGALFDTTFKLSGLALFFAITILIYSLLLYFNVIKTEEDDAIQQTRNNLQPK